MKIRPQPTSSKTYSHPMRFVEELYPGKIHYYLRKPTDKFSSLDIQKHIINILNDSYGPPSGVYEVLTSHIIHDDKQQAVKEYVEFRYNLIS